MGDLSQKNAATPVFVVGSTDAEGTEGTPVGATTDRELTNVDTINHGAIDAVLTVTNTASEGKVGASRKVNRKYIWFMPITVPTSPNAWILWGFTGSTQSFKVFKDQLLCFPIGSGTEVWFKSPVVGSFTVAFGEGS